jgi:hypothetical protein
LIRASFSTGTWIGVFNTSGQRLAYNDDIGLFRFELSSETPRVNTLFAEALHKKSNLRVTRSDLINSAALAR